VPGCCSVSLPVTVDCVRPDLIAVVVGGYALVCDCVYVTVYGVVQRDSVTRYIYVLTLNSLHVTVVTFSRRFYVTTVVTPAPDLLRLRLRVLGCTLRWVGYTFATLPLPITLPIGLLLPLHRCVCYALPLLLFTFTWRCLLPDYVTF